MLSDEITPVCSAEYEAEFGPFEQGFTAAAGVMGKLIDAQSIVVASAATRWFNQQGEILRYDFIHSAALDCRVGALVTLQACVWPFRAMVVR